MKEQDTKSTESEKVVAKTVVKTIPTILFSDTSLVETCLLQKGATFAEIEMVTTPRMNKTGNRFIGLVEKFGRMNIMIGDEYAKGVQRKADKEGLDVVFVPQPQKWNHHVGNSKFVLKHNDRDDYYLQCRVLASHDVEYRWIESGTPLTEAEVVEMKSFFPPKREGTAQPAKDKVIYRSPKVENITKIKMNGVRFVRAK